jgi:hypothetical protein
LERERKGEKRRKILFFLRMWIKIYTFAENIGEYRLMTVNIG